MRTFVRRLFAVGVAVAMSLTGVVVAASPASAAVVTPFTAGFNQAVYGEYVLVGNTVMTCPVGDATCTSGQNSNDSALSTTYPNDSFLMRYSDVDSDSTTFNSGTARYKVPPGATVQYARLWWGGNTGEVCSRTANR